MRPFRHLVIWGLLSLPASVAFAQGCSVCKTSAEAAAAEQQKALNRGILMLAVPSVVIFGGLSIFAVRYRAKGTAKPSERAQNDDSGLL